jgi:hypothetical protein
VAIQYPNNAASNGTYYTNSSNPYIDLTTAVTGYRSILTSATTDSWSNGDVVSVFVKASATQWEVWDAIYDSANLRLTSNSGAAIQDTNGTIGDAVAVEVYAVASKSNFESYLTTSAELADLDDVAATSPDEGDVLTYSSGAWGPAAASGGGGGRTALSGATFYYVNPSTGNDSNDGSFSTPWATVDKFFSVLPTLDLKNNYVTLSLSSGSHSIGFGTLSPEIWLGQGYQNRVQIVGDGTSSTTLNWGNSPFYISGGRWYFSALNFSYSGNHCFVVRDGELELYDVWVTPGSSYYPIKCEGGKVLAENFSIMANSAGAAWATKGGYVELINVYFDDTAISDYTLKADWGGMIKGPSSWSGTPTGGTKYLADRQGLIDANSTTIPGSSAGSTSNGGIYVA